MCCGGSLSLRIVIVASRIVTLMIVVRWRLFSKVSDVSFHSLRRVNQIRGCGVREGVRRAPPLRRGVGREWLRTHLR